MFDAVSLRMSARSAAVLQILDTRLRHILAAWFVLALLACSLRYMAAPVPIAEASLRSFAPYALLVLAPLVSVLLALRWFADADQQPQPVFRLAIAGSWRAVPAAEARRHPLFGTSGIMVSLLVGILFNVPVRAAEFLAAMPAMPIGAPQWALTLQLAMTVDVVVFSCLYAIVFVAALKRHPLFPRLLVAVWMGDLLMQLLVGQFVVHNTQLPPAVAGALEGLLIGNVKKVLISVSLWLPYLLLSARVNVTYRHRIPA